MTWQRTTARIVVLLILVLMALTVIFFLSVTAGDWRLKRWLQTGASFPSELEIESAIYTHYEFDLCSEGVYRINAKAAAAIGREGAAYLNGLGPNREGEVFEWAPMQTADVPAFRNSGGGPFCYFTPSDDSEDWPGLPAGGAYKANDRRGRVLTVYPNERVAYYLNQ